MKKKWLIYKHKETHLLKAVDEAEHKKHFAVTIDPQQIKQPQMRNAPRKRIYNLC